MRPAAWHRHIATHRSALPRKIQDGKKAKGHDLSRAAKPAKKRPGFSP